MLDLVRAEKISGGQNLTFSQRKQSFYFRVDFLFQNNQSSAHSQTPGASEERPRVHRPRNAEENHRHQVQQEKEEQESGWGQNYRDPEEIYETER